MTAPETLGYVARSLGVEAPARLTGETATIEITTAEANLIRTFRDGLFAPAPTVTDWAGVLAVLEHHTEAWVTERDGDQLTLTFLFGINPEAPDEGVVLSKTTEGEQDTNEQVTRVLQVATKVVTAARARLAETFRPNVAVPTLPPPFVVDLSPRLPDSKVNADRFTVRYTQMGPNEQPPDRVRIAMLDVAVPESWHNHNTHYVYDPAQADTAAIENCIIDAIDAGAKQGIVRALLLPEYFIPARSLLKVRAHATERGLLLIGGVEARSDSSGRSINEVVVQVPGRFDLYQRKQRPSVFELDQSKFAGNHELHLVRNTVLGNLGVIVCSDFLEADLVSQLAVQGNYRLHTLVVCARNPQPQVFETLARADAIRLYAHVIVVNSTNKPRTDVSDTGGCLVAAPRRNLYSLAEEPIDLEPISPVVDPPRLLMYDLEGAEIYRRNKRRTDAPHWLPPSLFAQQG